MTRGRPRTRRRWLRRLLLALLILLVLPAALLWWLSTDEPGYWRVIDAEEPVVRESGERFERRIASQLTRVRPAASTWQLRIEQRRANQWLAVRLPLWLANHGVDERARRIFEHPMVVIREGYIETAVRADLPGLNSIIRLRYEPVRPEGDGEDPVRLVLRSIHAGRLPLPVDSVIEQVVQRVGGQVDRDAQTRRAVEDALRELRSIELARSLEDGRRVSVVDIELNDGAAILTCRTKRVADN